MSKDTGGPAFPLPLGTMNAAEPDESGGMTLRDYFAAAVMQGIHAAGEGHGWDRDKERAERAYKQADAMLAERSK